MFILVLNTNFPTSLQINHDLYQKNLENKINIKLIIIPLYYIKKNTPLGSVENFIF